MTDTILVLDDEVQPEYRYLAPEIAKKIPNSEYHVYPEITGELNISGYDGVIISGSTASVYDESHPWIEMQCSLVDQCINKSIPLLGICFGHQLINWALSGEVVEDRRRATFVRMEQTQPDGVIQSVGSLVPVLHSDIVTKLGDGMISTAKTKYSDNFCTRHTSAPVWSVQFHPEFSQQVADQPSDWDSGSHKFSETTASKVLDNFAKICSKKET